MIEDGFDNGVPHLAVSDYDCSLTSDQIAQYAIEPRDASKLLVWTGSEIKDRRFHELDQELGADVLLVANDTKVIPARLHALTSGGHQIEIFLLKPLDAEWLRWEAMVGNRKRFREGDEAVVSEKLTIKWLSREENQVQFELPEGYSSMPEAIEDLGKVPLPPYIDRGVEVGDKERYQAIFAEKTGAVAAPTASLHFTEELEQRILGKGIGLAKLTLHVGAGTFKPMTGEFSHHHDMHSERFEINQDLIAQLLLRLYPGESVRHVGMESEFPSKRGGRVVAIGTTSMRVLESLYYIGVRILGNQWMGKVETEDAYCDLSVRLLNREVDLKESLLAILDFCERSVGILGGETKIFIVAGFNFRICDGLITNFHQPKSTLLMLVDAFLGGKWRGIYEHAHRESYRFLSYGDGSLLWR
ncbi:MAG: S-adenosylmethionine tRNA ribosyltransferase [Flavobacteriales bacterium]|nr:MAG: S-adenosylmethionine tRNA ribosyltransferase [Flavobacteriales bacterium]